MTSEIVGYNNAHSTYDTYVSSTSYPVVPGTYPDGTPLIDSKLMFRGFDDLLVRPTSMQSFVTAMFLVDAIRDRGGKMERLILPSIPGARQDRLNPEGDYLFTVKSVAKMINDRGFDEVVTVDPHSNVGPALIDRCHVVPLAEVLTGFNLDSDGQEVNLGYEAVIAPDAGASRRAFEVAQLLEIPVWQAGKHRDVATGKLSGFEAPRDVKEYGKYLLVDDICDGGGTFLGLAGAFPKYARLDLYVTHGIFSQGTDKLLERFDNIFTTDSTLFESPGVKKIQIIERLRSSK